MSSMPEHNNKIIGYCSRCLKKLKDGRLEGHCEECKPIVAKFLDRFERVTNPLHQDIYINVAGRYFHVANGKDD